MNIKLAENEKVIFWDNRMTQKLENGYRIILAEQKSNGFHEYLLLKKNKPIYSNISIEGVWYHYEALRLAKKLL